MSIAIQKSRIRQLKYARDRESKHLLWIKTQDRRIMQEISDINQTAMEAALKEAQGWTAKYAGANGLTMAQAVQAAKTADIEALARKARVYVKTKDFTAEANAEMKLYNFAMKMSRHELLLRHLDLERIAAGSDAQKALTGYLEDMTLNELTRQAGLLGPSLPQENFGRLARTIANESFHGTKFSQRIWQNQADLRIQIERGVSKSLLLGQHPTRWMTELKGSLTDAFAGSDYALKRIAVTESARAQISAQKASFEGAGYEWFEFIAEPTACEICQALDGRIMPVKMMSIGANAPPIHPNCRCSTSASMGPEEEKTLPEAEETKTAPEKSAEDIAKAGETGYNNLLPLDLQFFADKRSDKEKLLEKFKNKKLPKGRFNKNKRLFEVAFKNGVLSKEGTVISEKDAIYHVANRHPRLAYRSDFTQLIKQALLHPEIIIETIDKNGAPGVSYVKNVRDFGPIIVITRDGKIISAYDTNQKYINSQIKKGKVIYDGSKS